MTDRLRISGSLLDRLGRLLPRAMSSPSSMSRAMVAAFVLLTMIGSAGAQTSRPAPGLPPDWQFGYHLFQLLLEQKNLTSITSFEDALNNPSDSVIVLTGNLSWLDRGDWANVRSFLRRGGAMLIASDKAVRAPDLCVIEAGPIQVSEPTAAYQGFSDCPRIDDLRGLHPVARNVDLVIGNRSGWISRTLNHNGSWSSVAFLPRFDGSNANGIKSPVIATMSVNGSRTGRLMVAADHSLFINGMLWHGNNAILALNTADWLCSTGRRSKLLFMADGTASQSGIPMPIPPVRPEDLPPFNLEDLADTPPESIITFINTFVTGLEDENVFNQVLANHASELPAPDYYQQIYLTLAAIAGYWVIRQLLRRGRRFEAPASRPVVEAASSRAQDMLNSNDLQRPLRELSRDLFRTLTGSDDPKDWSVWPGSLQVSSLKQLERIATDVDRRPVSKRSFQRMVKQIERIRQMHEQGRLTKQAG